MGKLVTGKGGRLSLFPFFVFTIFVFNRLNAISLIKIHTHMKKLFPPRKKDKTYAVVYLMIAFRNISKLRIDRAFSTKKSGRL